MDIDLLFTVVTEKEWRSISEEGQLSNTFMDGEKSIWCFEGTEAEAVINHYFKGKDQLLLIVLDPLRIQSPFKRIKEQSFELVEIKDAVSLDAIIDKIKLSPDKKGGYSVNVRHFD